MYRLILIILILTITVNYNFTLRAENLNANKFKHGEYFNSGSVSGGEIADGLDVKNIRWAKRGNFERLVFDIYKWGGPTNPEGILPNINSGTFKFTFKSDTQVDATFEGYRAFSAKFPVFTKSELVREIKIDQDEENAGDSEYKIIIYFKQPVKIEVFELYSPARIVVDIIENKTE